VINSIKRRRIQLFPEDSVDLKKKKNNQKKEENLI